eukprot:CAMPEP_0119551196 /NCGR_PEP_ID=MMETSP1352-20130426/4505_1 /TAXON_ID=265584 /ORGANISM="Stauroneis constricta, Strain CCMP1120" /LENGTH=382 /DNA_ID=CAMNT_0007597209 /DNA_START=197 /DNA_END=1345 /DNA_ORIENTATION=+
MSLETPAPLIDVGRNETVGYSCERLVAVNTLGEAETTFYFDMAVPSGDDVEAGLDAVRQHIIQGIADQYGFTDDLACSERVNTDWLVQFTARSSQFTKVDLFDKCTKMVPVEGENCGFYEGKMSAKVVLPMPDASLPLVSKQIQAILDAATFDDAALRVQFTGAPVVDPTGGQNNGGRDELKPPTSVEREPEPAPKSDGDNTITIVGGLLVAAFALAFLGIVLVLWRRRQSYLDERDTQFAISKSDLQYQQPHPTNTESKSHDGEDDHMVPQITLSMEDGGVATSRDFDPDETQPISNVSSPTDNSYGHRKQQDSMEFDFGNSFKDQLMGVHGRHAHPRPGYGMTLQGIPDSTSESDADSWAQTDGTIGSLELQLEPITAEV